MRSRDFGCRAKRGSRRGSDLCGNRPVQMEGNTFRPEVGDRDVGVIDLRD